MLMETFNDSTVQYFQPGDEKDLAKSILELYRNPEKRLSLADHGSDVYKKCKWSVMKYEYLKVYDDVLS
jgi:hypothetical protein